MFQTSLKKQQMKEFRFLEVWDSLKIHQWNQLGEMLEFLEFMKVLTKSTDFFL